MAEVARLSVRTELRGGSLDDVVRVTRGSIAGKEDIVLFIHGFNNDAKDALYSFDRCVEVLQKRYGVPYVDIEHRVATFYWPGDESPNKGMSKANYFRQVRKAERVADRLAMFLYRHALDVGHLRLTIAAHSLGCRVALHTMSALRSAHEVTQKAAYLMAAAVPVAHCEPDSLASPYRHQAAGLEIVLFSKRDAALGLPFRIGQTMAKDGGLFPEAVGRFGHPTSVGMAGTERWTTRVDTDLQHGEYWTEPASVDFLAGAFGRSPPWRLPGRSLSARMDSSAG